MPDLCAGPHTWFYRYAEDFCVVCGLHQMDREDAEELDWELTPQFPEYRLVWVPQPV